MYVPDMRSGTSLKDFFGIMTYLGGSFLTLSFL